MVAGHGKPTPSKLDFRLNVIAHKMVGQYIEVGPLSGEWKGAMIGVSEGATILIHAVGKRGELPERAVPVGAERLRQERADDDGLPEDEMEHPVR